MPKRPTKFSLVLATINRIVELERFLSSLNAQTYRDFELIVVDQNTDDRLVSLLKKYESCFPITHLRSTKGLSHARNIGLKYITGDIVCFPDDDCWYSPQLLCDVFNFFQDSQGLVGVTGITVNEKGEESVTNWDKLDGYITKLNVWRRCTSISIFLKSFVFENQRISFDERLGVGAKTPWGAGEDNDLILSAISLGRVYYTRNIVVGHRKNEANDLNQYRALSYGRGMGKVLRKHAYPVWFVGYLLIKPLGGAIISILLGKWSKAVYHKALIIGRYQGWRSEI